MFSALKKRLTVRQDDSKVSPFPSGVAVIGQVMQKKFAKGVHYNSMIFISGLKQVLKSISCAKIPFIVSLDGYQNNHEILKK